jgi:hypothetical protein
VTEALQDLAAAGLVRQGRGQLWVVNRRGLEARACECHMTLKGALNRLIGEAPANA